jgi:hypothetical protein
VCCGKLLRRVVIEAAILASKKPIDSLLALYSSIQVSPNSRLPCQAVHPAVNFSSTPFRRPNLSHDDADIDDTLFCANPPISQDSRMSIVFNANRTLMCS